MRPELQPGAFSPPAPPPPRKGGELAEWTLRLPWPFPGLLPAPSWHLPSSLPGGEVACSPLLLMPLPSPPAGAALEPAAWPSHFPHRAQENPPPESHPPPRPSCSAPWAPPLQQHQPLCWQDVCQVWSCLGASARVSCARKLLAHTSVAPLASSPQEVHHWSWEAPSSLRVSLLPDHSLQPLYVPWSLESECLDLGLERTDAQKSLVGWVD